MKAPRASLPGLRGITRHAAVFIIGSFLSIAPAHAAAPASCRPAEIAPIMVRIGNGTAPRRALLRGGVFPPLSVEAADTGQILWSAAAGAPATQLFPAMRAQFAGSLLPVDLDGDGLHDRIYAGDLGGQLWRFDLHHGAAPAVWASGGVFADFSGPTGRGFLAPPDVSLPSASEVPTGASPWFNIALGTARVATGFFDNRFYVVRDAAPFKAWSAADYARWQPLRETDLVQLARMGDALSTPAPNGYFFSVGAGDVLSPSLTVSGRATLAIGGAGVAAPGCQIAVTVASIDIATASEHSAAPAGSSAGTGAAVVARPVLSVTAGAPFSLKVDAHGQAACSLGGTRVAACDVDTTPARTWWRREDAD